MKLNSETVLHEILLLQGTAALGEQLKVQNSVLPLTTSAPLPNLHSSLFLYNKIKFLYNLNNDSKDFTGGTVLEEEKKVPKELITKEPQT